MCAVIVHARDLTLHECEKMLRALHVGAIAFTFHDRVSIALVNYVYRDGWIYVRLEDRPDADALRHHQWAAFEAREAAGIYDWRTVSVNGGIELLSTSAPHVAREFDQAVEVLRSIVPAVFTARDPMPERVHVLRLHADVINGREARAHPQHSLDHTMPLPAT